MANKEGLGTKRTCPECSAKFYDLGKDPVVCPKCGHSYKPEGDVKAKAETPAPVKKATPAKKAAEKSEDIPEAEAEPVVSFEDADEEALGAKSTKAAALDDDDLDVEDDDIDLPDNDDDDVGIIADEDDFKEDVTAIIDADIEKSD